MAKQTELHKKPEMCIQLLLKKYIIETYIINNRTSKFCLESELTRLDFKKHKRQAINYHLKIERHKIEDIKY